MTHAELVDRAVAWLRRSRGCGVVLREHYAWMEAPDAIGWKHGGALSIQVECKVSRGDFRADRDKPCRKRWSAHGIAGRPAHECWYLIPHALNILDLEVPAGWGLLRAGSRSITVATAAPLEPPRHPDLIAAERDRLYFELRRYQVHGLTYPTVNASILQRRAARKAIEP